MVSCRIQLLKKGRQIATEVTEDTESLCFKTSVFSVLSVANFVLVCAGARHRTRAVRERAHAEKDLDVGAPLWVPRPILIVEKRVFGLGERHSEPRRRGTTPITGERGEVSPEYVAPVSRPACRSGFPDSEYRSANRPSSARVSRTRAINGGQGRDAVLSH